MEIECLVIAGEINKCIVEAVTAKQCVGPVTCSLLFLKENVAAIIACCALGITFWQGSLTRKYNKLSVIPHLTILKQYNMTNEPSIKFAVQNDGLGPAQIIAFKMKINNQEIDTTDIDTWLPLLQNHLKPAFIVKDPEDKNVQNFELSHDAEELHTNSKIPANTHKRMFHFLMTPVTGYTFELNGEKAKALTSKVDITIQYKSIYGGKLLIETSNQG